MTLDELLAEVYEVLDHMYEHPQIYGPGALQVESRIEILNWVIATALEKRPAYNSLRATFLPKPNSKYGVSIARHLERTFGAPADEKVLKAITSAWKQITDGLRAPAAE